MLTPSNTQLPPPCNWEDFEHLCWLLWREEWKDKNAQKHGRRGQRQHGVDVFGHSPKCQWSGVQCKGKDNYSSQQVTISELESEVEKAKRFQPQLSEFILATTAPRDAVIQAAARRLTDANRKEGLFSVHVFSWDCIRGLLDLHPDTLAAMYPGSAVARPARAYTESHSKLRGTIQGHQRSSVDVRLDAHLKEIKATVISGLYMQGHDMGNVTIPDVTPEQISQIVFVLEGSESKEKQVTKVKGKPPAIVLSPKQTHALGLLVFCLSWTLSEIDELEYSSPPGVHDVPTQAVFPRAEGIDRSSPLA